MEKRIKILVWLTLVFLLVGCARIPEMATTTPSLPATLPQPTPTPEIQAPTATPIPPSPTPFARLPGADEVVFTILNPQPWSGREGDPRPDWLGWGAETFAIAPDGSFWIADSAADPHRLLHYSAQGELLLQAPLEGSVIYPFHMVAAQDSLWVLDNSGMQSRAVQFSLEGAVLSQVVIPPEPMTIDGMYVSNTAYILRLGQQGELLLYTWNGVYELLDASGALVSQLLEVMSYYGHTYQIDATVQFIESRSILVDGAPLETPADFSPEPYAFLGFNPDGSFALTGFEHSTGDWDHQVLYYRASGELLGRSRSHFQLFYTDWNHDLAFGPDGSVYQLVSYPDHSVQIVRLGFTAELPPVTNPPPLPIPKQLEPLLPSDSPTTDEAQARNALLGFFASLSAGEYAQAAALFGGEFEDTTRPPEPGESPEAYWADICNFLCCLPIAEVTAVEQVSADEYRFYVVFAHPLGGRLDRVPCCSAFSAAHPPVWQFAYPVQRVDGVWKVMRAPLFITP
ncbi:MAG TPA: hypothetical protein VLM83_08255 [Anaerolineales bacterium]|nr:hypothetical protein [Anaerolineales bacterium]